MKSTVKKGGLFFTEEPLVYDWQFLILYSYARRAIKGIK
jgi:hypothetical protein